MNPVFQADCCQHLHGPPVQLHSLVPAADTNSKLDILDRAQSPQQVVLLKNEADLFAYFFQGARPRIAQLFPQNPDAAFLRGTQRTHQCEHGRLARARRAGNNDDFTSLDIGCDVKKDLFPQITSTKGMIQATDADGCFLHHQNTSAGSRRRTLRTASRPEIAHMLSVIRNTVIARSWVMYSGRLVAAAALPYNQYTMATPGT